MNCEKQVLLTLMTRAHVCNQNSSDKQEKKKSLGEIIKGERRSLVFSVSRGDFSFILLIILREDEKKRYWQGENNIFHLEWISVRREGSLIVVD